MQGWLVRWKNRTQEERLASHNRATSLADGMIDAFAMGMVHWQTMVVYFMSGYIKSAMLLGLLTAIRVFAGAVAEPVLFRHMHGRAYYKGVFLLVGAIARLTWLLMGLAILFISETHTTWFVILFFILTAVQGFAYGGISLAWTSLMNKVIPARSRARYLGFRSACDMLTSVLGAQFVTLILADHPKAVGFGILFLVAAAIDFVSLIPLAMMKEWKSPDTVERTSRTRPSLIATTRDAFGDRNFRRHLLASFAIMCAFTALQFQSQFAENQMGMDAAGLANMATLTLAGQAIGYIAGGWLQSWGGYRLVQLTGFSLTVVYLVMALLPAGQSLFIAMAGIWGLGNALYLLSARNIVAFLVPYEKRMAYFMLVGVMSSISGALFPLTSGLMFDLMGFKAMCAVLLVPAALSIVLAFGIREQKFEDT
nr:MFS transporter [bacterium]